MTFAPRRWRAALAAPLLLLAAPAAAQDDPGIKPPPFTGLVVDAANVLPPATRADLTAKLQSLQHDTHRQLVVATIPDLGGRDVADYGYRLGRAWGVGLRDVNNGAILFIAPNEPAGHRGPRIEVGYGLEPVLTDALSSTIIRDDMMPRLRSGDVPGAMEAGTDAIIQQLRASPDEAKARTGAAVAAFDKTHRHAASGGGGGGGLILVFWLFVIGFFVLSRFRHAGASGGGWSGGGGRRYDGGSGLGSAMLWGAMLGAMHDRGRRDDGWGGGGGWSGGGDGGGSDGGSSGGWGDGGFSGGGGGSFGGGGASGDW